MIVKRAAMIQLRKTVSALSARSVPQGEARCSLAMDQRVDSAWITEWFVIGGLKIAVKAIASAIIVPYFSGAKWSTTA